MHTGEEMSDGHIQKAKLLEEESGGLRREFIGCFLMPRLVGLLLHARQCTRHWGHIVISNTRVGPAFAWFNVCWGRELPIK